MYFQKYGPRITWLDQCLKSRVSSDPSEATWSTRPNIVEICMAAHLRYLLIAVKAIDLQKVSVSDMQNLKTFS